MGGDMTLVCDKTNLGVGNMMASLKITENVTIKVFLAILGSWRWGPYVDPDQWRYHQVSARLSEGGSKVLSARSYHLQKDQAATMAINQAGTSDANVTAVFHSAAVAVKVMSRSPADSVPTAVGPDGTRATSVIL